MKLTELLLESLLGPDAPSTPERHPSTRDHEDDENAPAERLACRDTKSRIEMRRPTRQVNRDAQSHQKRCVNDTSPLFACGALPI